MCACPRDTACSTKRKSYAATRGESVEKASTCRIVAHNTIRSLAMSLWIAAVSKIQGKFRQDEYERHLR